MFVLYSLLKLLAVPIALILIGLVFLPADALYLLVGALTALAGLIVLFYSLKYGLTLLIAGGLLFAVGTALRKRIIRERLAAAEAVTEAARRASRVMDVHIPKE
jgi:hypothetical protein